MDNPVKAQINLNKSGTKRAVNGIQKAVKNEEKGGAKRKRVRSKVMGQRENKRRHKFGSIFHFG
jgi:hypothetical protein